MQLSWGTFKHRINEPPSNVILDDRAVYEVLQSNIPRAQLSQRWSHDFSGQANVRHRRPHRGRPVYKDEEAEDDSDKYESVEASRKNPSYLFTGEKDFTPVFYHELSEGAKPPQNESEDESEEESPKKPKQHNQYTAPHLLVRNGAESQSQTKGKYRDRVNTFLRRDPDPDWVKYRRKLFGGVGMGKSSPYTSSPLAQSSSFGFSFASAPAPTGPSAPGESLWVEQDDEPAEQAEDEDDPLPSVFDEPEVTSSRRRAPQGFSTSSRSKKSKPMGYIERLAAGLLDEESDAAGERQIAAMAGAGGVENGALVADLQDELEIARGVIGDKDTEIAALKSELEELKAMMASGRSVDDE